MNNSKKKIFAKILYIISWAVLLMFSTFPMLLTDEMVFDFRTMSLPEAGRMYYYPMFMVMALFLVDAVYSVHGAFGYVKNGSFATLIVCLIVFFVATAFSMLCGKNMTILCFVISWIALGVMKYIEFEKPVEVTAFKAKGFHVEE